MFLQVFRALGATEVGLNQDRKRRFVGVVPLARRLLFGATAAPKVRKYGNTVTPNPNADSTTNYETWKPESYRWFRQDEMVRRCIIYKGCSQHDELGLRN